MVRVFCVLRLSDNCELQVFRYKINAQKYLENYILKNQDSTCRIIYKDVDLENVADWFCQRVSPSTEWQKINL